MLLDLDNGRVSFSKNGVPQGIAYQELTNVPVTPAVCVGGAAYVRRVNQGFLVFVRQT